MKGDRWNNPYAYVRALCGYAGLETRSIAIDRLEQYVSGAPSRRDRDELARALRNRLPLEQWVGLHTDAAERLVRLVLNLDRSSDGQEVSHSDEDLAWAIFSVIRSANRFGRPLTVAMLEEARAWGDRLLQKKLPGEHFYLQSTFNAATHLTYLLALDDGARDDVVRKALAGGLRTAEDAPSQGSMGVWISLVEAGVSPTGAAMTEAADRLLINLDETWESLLTFAKNNPHYAWPPVAFLAQAIILGLTKDLSLARERLLQLVQAAPDHLSLCAGLLDARFWGDQWQPFLDHVWKLSGGGDGPDPVAARTGAVDLLLLRQVADAA